MVSANEGGFEDVTGAENSRRRAGSSTKIVLDLILEVSLD